MKTIQNEKGYTLLLTLVIIFIIIMFFSSFALSAMNQQKHVKKTDDTYEVTAIAEMGVEYYRARVLNAIETARQNTIIIISDFKSINKPTVKQIEDYENAISGVKLKLIEEIKGYKITNNLTTAEKMIDESNKIFFGLNDTPEIDGDLISLNIRGYIGDVGEELSKEKEIKVKFNLPNTFTIKNDNPSKSEEPITNTGIQLLPIPNFLASIITPKFPPQGVLRCPIDYKTNQCYSEGFSSDTKNIKDITIYFTKSSINMPNDKNLQDSTFYFNENTTINNNLEKIKNAVFHIKGNVIFKSLLEVDDNILIQSTGDGTFNSNVKIKDSLNIFLQGTATFLEKVDHNTENNNDKTGLLLYAKGASFKGLDLKNSIFEIGGNLTFTEPASFKNSQIHSIGLTTAKQIEANNFSKFYFDNGLILNSYLNANNSSEIYIKANDVPVRADKIDINNSTLFLDGPINRIQNGFNINNNSKICLKNTSISNLQIHDANSKVHFLGKQSDLIYSQNQNKNYSAIFYTDIAAFNSVCTYPTNTTIGNSSPNYDPIPIIHERDFIHSVIYK